jgi:hypothetical protein
VAELSPELKRKFDAHIKRYARKGIRLHRPYPPHLVKSGRSKFGGLPNLPQAHHWPVGRRDGVPMPMHFMVQIDFAELPRFGHKLPPTGMLFVFGCDIDMDWSSDNQDDDVRVIYLAEVEACTPQRQLPSDMISVGGDHPPGDWYLPGEIGSVLHPEWPILPQTFNTFPEYAPTDDYSIYREYVVSLREAEIGRLGAATGWSAERAAFGPLLDLQAWFQGKIHFPPIGFTLNQLARYFIKHLRAIEEHEDRRELSRQSQPFAARLFERSLEIGEAGDVPEADGAALAAWIQDAQSKSIRSDWLRAQHWCDKALTNTIEHFAGRPEVLGTLAPQLMEWAGQRYSCVSYFRYDQMLGWAKLCQEIQSLDATDVCLLQLQRPEGGEVTIWIDPGDLERRDFNRTRVWAHFS